MREIKFRAWTGKEMYYQDDQYLASFVRRAVPKIIGGHGGDDYRDHESYLPNGGDIAAGSLVEGWQFWRCIRQQFIPP
jgi:hypothetical protein